MRSFVSSTGKARRSGTATLSGRDLPTSAAQHAPGGASRSAAGPSIGNHAMQRLLSNAGASRESAVLAPRGASVGVGDVAPPSVHEALSAAGRPLDAATRAPMEARFGCDFSDVRVHSGDAAARSAREVGAQAYTVGRDIVFGAGRFAPGTSAGQRLLAHELAHTVQQRGARDAGDALRIGAEHDAHERAADASSVLAARGQAATVSGRLDTARVQRAPGDSPPITADTDFSAIQARLDAIVRSGPMPTQTRVIGAAIIDVPGYRGPREIRALSSMETDALGQGADVHHAVAPQNRTLTATRGIYGSGVRREFPFSHINDAEIKLFEEIRANLPPGAKGTVHFTTMRFRLVNGQQVLEPIPACSGCNRATFEMAGGSAVMYVSHAPAHPTTTLDLAGASSPVGGGSPGTPPRTPTPAPPKAPRPEIPPPTAGARRSTTRAEIGAPLTAPNEATPGYAPARGAAWGAAAQMLHSRMFGNIQNAEVAKYEKRLAQLQPKIDAYLESGQSVELILIVEKPDRPDVLCGAGVFCDASQFIYFRELFINRVESEEPTIDVSRLDTKHAHMYAPGGREGFVPYTHQGGSLTDESEIPFLAARHRDHHCEYAKQTLHPSPRMAILAPKRAPAPTPTKKPRSDPATRRAMASQPAKLYTMSHDIVRYGKVVKLREKLANDPSFVLMSDSLGGYDRSRTAVVYFSDLDKPRAEALAAFLRAQGIATAYAEMSGDGGDDPGGMQIMFGRDID